MAKKIKMVNVESSNIKAIGHDLPTNTLRIKFHNKSVWDYTPIPENTHTEIMAAESKGKYFNSNVKSKND